MKGCSNQISVVMDAICPNMMNMARLYELKLQILDTLNSEELKRK